MGQPKRKERAEGDRPAEEKQDLPPPGDFEVWKKPTGLGRNGWLILGGVVLLTQVPLIHRALRPAQEAPVAIPYADDFSNRATVEENYWSTGGHWRTVNGELLSPGVKNNPLWLKAKLPNDVSVEFDVRSESPEGDVKVEIFGDGLDHASGYVLIHGGWNNSVSIIARLDEHGKSLGQLEADARAVAQQFKMPNAGVKETGVFKADTHMRVEARGFPVQVGKTYRWRIERRGATINWSIDGQPYMQFTDPFPLTGEKHNRLGFSSWEAQLFFDNLSIKPL